MNLTRFIVICAIVFFLVPTFVLAANLHGFVYDLSLTKVREAQLTIDSVPVQRQITQNGAYSFEVVPGTYTLTAEYYEHSLLLSSVKEEVSIQNEGSFVYDLILFPIISEDLEIDEEEMDFSGDFFLEEERRWTDFVVIILALGFVCLLVYLFYQRKPPALETLDDEDLKKMLNFIKKEKRTTQKDVRVQFPQSEAKVSLMITELEDKGLIKKIKKGRGNVIIFQKKKSS